MAQKTLTGQDVVSVASKLENFLDQLPEQEKNVLNWILQRAQTALPISQAQSATAQPQKLKTPLATQIARSAGLVTAQGDSVNAGWSHSF